MIIAKMELVINSSLVYYTYTSIAGSTKQVLTLLSLDLAHIRWRGLTV